MMSRTADARPDKNRSRSGQADVLPVAQLKPSHDLVVDPDQLPEHDVLAVIPVYENMGEGDEVTFLWEGYYSGQLESEWSSVIPVGPSQTGRPLVARVPRFEALLIEGGYAQVGYRLVPAGGGASQDSPVQTFDVTASFTPRLEPPTVVDHTAGDPVDPGDYPQGLVVRIDIAVGLQLDDHIVLYGDGIDQTRSFIDSMQVDSSHLQSGVVEFTVDPGWLTANDGAALTLAYQFARPGAGKSSEPLVLEIRKVEPLPPPVIERASAEGEPGDYHGFLQAMQVIDGVFVNVPESVYWSAGDGLEMHWQGHPAGGQYVAPTPVSDQTPRRFFIPSSAVPANMGSGETKRFDVFFRFDPAAGKARNSIPFGLRIVPPEQNRYQSLQWDRLSGTTTLSLQTVPADGEVLRLDGWPFMAQGQLVTFEVSGVAATGGAARTVVRDALPVTAAELSARQVRGRLPRAFLQSLKLNEYITLSAAISFDAGDTRMLLPYNSGVRLIL